MFESYVPKDLNDLMTDKKVQTKRAPVKMNEHHTLSPISKLFSSTASSSTLRKSKQVNFIHTVDVLSDS